VDDVATTSLLHQRNRLVTTVEDTEYIRLKHGAKVFRTHIFHSCKNSHTGVVDENIDAVECLYGVFEESGYVIVIPDVADSTRRLTAIELVQIGNGPLKFILTTATYRHVEASVDESFGDCLADSFRSARDDRNFAV